MAELIKVPGLTVERLIARGGMAEVFLAEQKSLGRKVAVKVMDLRSGDVEFSTRFLQEAKLLASLGHNNIITIYDFGTLDNGRLYLTMEYLPGGDLERRIKKGAIPEAEAIRITKELARALQFVHKQGVVHRDIKPANILFRQDGSLVLTDFGIAKGKQQDAAVTQTGMTVGSPAYSSPEQAQGLELTFATDLYSVGVVLLEMFLGSNPYRAETSIDTAIKHIQMTVPRLRGKLARYQPLLDKMLAKKPKERFKSMLDMLEHLDQLTGATGNNRYADSPSVKEAAHFASQAPELFKRCREESQTFSAPLLAAFHQQINKKLDDLLESSRSNVQQWQLMSVTREFRKQRNDLNKIFGQQLEAGFNAFSRGEFQSDYDLQSVASDLNNLSLVAHEELDRNIAAADLVKRASEALQETLLPLHERFSALLKKEMPQESCPVGPYQLAQYFRKTLEPLQLDKQMNTLCFKTLEKILITQLKELYQSLDKMLIEAGVLPKLTYSDLIRRQKLNSIHEPDDNLEDEYFDSAQQSNDSPAIRRNTGAYETVSSPAWQRSETIKPDAQLPSEAYQQQLFTAIRQMQYRAATAQPGEALFAAVNNSAIQKTIPSNNFAKGDWVPAGGVAGVNVSQQSATYTRRDVVTALHGLQGNVALADAPEKTGVTKAFRQIMPGNVPPAPLQSLETLIEAIAKISPDDGDEPKQLDVEDCGTIDLVGMIFDYMLKDEQLPDSVKALLSYLHVPYIKVALLDPELFAAPEHPARLLLDKLSEAGATWLNNEGFGQYRIFDEIKRVVDSILMDFNGGSELFVHLLAEFEDFIGKVKRRVDQLEKLAAQKAEAEQHLQKVKAVVHKHLKTRVSAERLPAPIVAILLYPWFDYLTSIMLRYGEKSEEWSQGLQVVDTLLWSIKPKSTQHEVHRLNNVKDFLLKQLQKGFDTIGYDQIKGQELLAQVEALLAAAAAPGMKELLVTAADTAEVERMHQDTTVREKVVEPSILSEMTDGERELVEKLRLIEFGTWFEFQEEDDPNRSQKLKVAWYSPDHLSYLMVNSAGKQVSVMTARELAGKMLSKSARIIAGSTKPFFERALEDIYQKMALATAVPTAH